jgi:hypothetical protein
MVVGIERSLLSAGILPWFCFGMSAPGPAAADSYSSGDVDGAAAARQRINRVGWASRGAGRSLGYNRTHTILKIRALDIRRQETLEVHPPDHGIHTWRDFFVHMATICLGLLLAIALEQTVELLHHRYERRELMENLHAEAEHNLITIAWNLHEQMLDQQWVLDSIDVLNKGQTVGGMISVTLPPLPAGKQQKSIYAPTHLPSRGVWLAAKANGEVGVLSSDETQIFDRLDFDADKQLATTDVGATMFTEVHATQARLGMKLQPGALLRLTPAQRDEIVSLFSRLYGAFGAVNLRSVIWYGADNAVAHRVRKVDEMTPYIEAEIVKMPQ